MRTSFFSFLLISCFFFSLSNLSHASQADQLRRLIKAKRSSAALHYNSWSLADASEVYKPVYMSPQVGLMDADKITALPGQPDNVKFNQYAGYVTVDAKAGRALFYYFVESPHDPSTKPLVLWLNGGPGCSSLGYGAMEELGPFRVNRDGKTLYRNNHAWNNVANVIFLESPAGVGFSYSNTSSDIDRSGDNTTAIDSYTFLVNWLERFPQYKTRDFFITGESYAGHYIPELAYTIIQSNQITNQTVINLRGVAMGNADIGAVENGLTGYDYFWTHALISDETYYMIHNLCNFSAPISDECEIALDKADNESGNIDIYNIYAPLCHGLNSSSSSGVSMADFDPCSDNYVYSYLNLPSVQRALHANVTALPYDWEACRNLHWKDTPATVVPLIEHVIAGGISVWLYSGDIDGVIPVTYTRKILSVLELPIEKPWRPWYSSGEVGGYVVEYKGLTFVTVRGAGHTVPSYQPERALTLISSFLQGKAPQ